MLSTTTHISDLGVKVVKFNVKSFWLKFLEVYIFRSFSWILLILCLILDTGLKYNAAPSPLPHLPWGQGHRLRNFMLRFLVNVFRIGYLLTVWMDLVDTIPDVRYWSNFYAVPFPPSPNLEVNITDLEFFMINEIYHIGQSSESIHLSNIRNLEGLLPFHNYWPQDTWHGLGLDVEI